MTSIRLYLWFRNSRGCRAQSLIWLARKMGGHTLGVPLPVVLSPMVHASIAPCCELEARAFNALRRRWGQPDQAARKEACLAGYLDQYPRGAKVAHAGGRLIGFCLSHRWGSLGWIGPVVVEPDWQGQGIGRALTEPAVQTLEADGCTTIALETWPHHLPNLRFYMQLGFIPLASVFILETAAQPSRSPGLGVHHQRLADSQGAMLGLRELSQAVSPGLDYSRPAEITLGCGLGEAILWGEVDRPWAAALVHTASQLEAAPPDWLEVFLLLIRPGRESRLSSCLAELRAYAASLGRRAIRLAVCTCHPAGLLELVRDRGFAIAKSRLRMVRQHVPMAATTVDYVSFGI